MESRNYHRIRKLRARLVGHKLMVIGGYISSKGQKSKGADLSKKKNRKAQQRWMVKTKELRYYCCTFLGLCVASTCGFLFFRTFLFLSVSLNWIVVCCSLWWGYGFSEGISHLITMSRTRIAYPDSLTRHNEKHSNLLHVRPYIIVHIYFFSIIS